MITVELAEGPIQIDPAKLALYSEDLWVGTKPSRKIFDKFIVFAEHYNSLDNKTKKMYDDLATLRGAKLRSRKPRSSWYDSLVSDITSADEIIKFVDLADICGNDTIYTVACFTLADDLERLASPDAIRAKYNIQNDLTEADQQQLNKEDEVWKLLH